MKKIMSWIALVSPLLLLAGCGYNTAGCTYGCGYAPVTTYVPTTSYVATTTYVPTSNYVTTTPYIPTGSCCPTCSRCGSAYYGYDAGANWWY